MQLFARGGEQRAPQQRRRSGQRGSSGSEGPRRAIQLESQAWPRAREVIPRLFARDTFDTATAVLCPVSITDAMPCVKTVRLIAVAALALARASTISGAGVAWRRLGQSVSLGPTSPRRPTSHQAIAMAHIWRTYH